MIVIAPPWFERLIRTLAPASMNVKFEIFGRPTNPADGYRLGGTRCLPDVHLQKAVSQNWTLVKSNGSIFPKQITQLNLSSLGRWCGHCYSDV